MRSIWRALLLLAVCCGISARLEAQGGFTTVTGTITDPNGLKYSCGTITAQLITAGGAAPTLNGGGFTTQTSPIGLGCPTSPGTGAPGSFLMRLADSGVIVPSNTTWRFTINLAPGIAPPAGTGPQSFSVTTAINCSTNTPATCTSNAMDISTLLSASAPAISNSSGGGITQFSSNVIDVTQAPYNVKTGFTIGDATFVSGQNTISIPNGDVTLTAAMNGWVCFGTNLGLDTDIINGPSTVILPQGTFTFVSASSGTCSGGNATANATATGVLVMGPDATSGLSAAWTAAVASCSTVQLPAGLIIDQSGQFNSNSSQDKCIIDRKAGYSVLGVQGWGSANSVIAVTPNFSSSSCTGTAAGDGCFFGSTAIQVVDLAIWGAGQGAIGAGFNGKVGVHLNGTDTITSGSNSYIYDVLLASWGATTAGFTGYKIDGESDALSVGVHNDGMGSVGCVFIPNFQGQITLYNQFCAVNNVKSAFITGPSATLSITGGGGQVNSHGGVYGFGVASGQAAIEVDGSSLCSGGSLSNPCVIFNSTGDTMPYSTAGSELWCHDSAVCHISQANILNTGGTGISFGSVGVVYIEHSTVTTTFASAAATKGGGATSQLLDLGGNTISSTNGKAVDLTSFGGQFYPNATSTYTGTLTDINAAFTSSTGACATTSTIVGLGNSGTVTCTGTTGASTLIITPHFTAQHGWSCAASDLTTAANILRQSATSTTTCTIAGTVNASDVITFLATPY